jgi:hypothetical protein
MSDRLEPLHIYVSAPGTQIELAADQLAFFVKALNLE